MAVGVVPLVAASCSQDGSSDEKTSNDPIEISDTRPPGLPQPEPADLDDIEKVWIDAGASPEVAGCRRVILEENGVTEVSDLADLAEAVSSLPEDRAEDFEDCLSLDS